MFSKRMVLIAGVIVVVMINIITLFLTARQPAIFNGPQRVAIATLSPFQNLFAQSVGFLAEAWHNYFNLVSVAQDNTRLKQALNQALERQNHCLEVELSNQRLRRLLSFQKTNRQKVLAAEVVARDPSRWFKTIIIDKGQADGVVQGLPVVVPNGIVGQVIEASESYAKVLLVVDQNSAVDALVQRSRARGVIKGEASGGCAFKYVLRKNDLRNGDVVVSSGLDGVFPKGLRVGRVTGLVKWDAGIFQDVAVTPYVDFEKLEEVLVLLNDEPETIAAKQP